MAAPLGDVPQQGDGNRPPTAIHPTVGARISAPDTPQRRKTSQSRQIFSADLQKTIQESADSPSSASLHEFHSRRKDPTWSNGAENREDGREEDGGNNLSVSDYSTSLQAPFNGTTGSRLSRSASREFDAYRQTDVETSDGGTRVISEISSEKPRSSTENMLRPTAWRLGARLRKEWFLFGVVVVILLARLYPPLGLKGGPIRPEITTKYGGVMLIFFNSGLSLRTREFRDALYAVKLHAVIQSYSFFVIPFLMSVAVTFLRTTSLHPALADGLLIVATLPPPVSSGVILTKAGGGNEAAAIFNSTFGSFLGIFLTPMLFFMLTSPARAVDDAVVGTKARGVGGPRVSDIMASLAVTVVFPLVCGQLARMFAERRRDPGLSRKLATFPFGSVNSGILLLIIYTVFCETFSNSIETKEGVPDDREGDGYGGSVSGMGILFLALFIALFQIAITLIMKRLAQLPRFGFSRSDVIATIFCSTHKSLTLGMPMLNVLITNPAQLSLVSIPLLIYHPMQILLGSLWVPPLKQWGSEQPSANLPKYSNLV